MHTFTTLLDATLAAQQFLNSEVIISEADGQFLIFSNKRTGKGEFPCFVNDGYQRYVEDGKMRMVKNLMPASDKG